MKKTAALFISILMVSAVFISCGSKPAQTSEKKEAPSEKVVLKDFFIAANDADYSDDITKITSIKTGSANKYRIFFVVEDSSLNVTKFFTSFDNFADPKNTTERSISKQSEETEWFSWQDVYFEGYAGSATFYAYAEDAEGNKSKVVTCSLTLDGDKVQNNAADAK